MTLIVIILALVLIFGGGGWYANRSYGMPGLGGVLGLFVVVMLILFLFGRL